MKFKFYILSLVVLLLDIGTKWIVQREMELYSAIELIPDYLRLSHIHNTGVAFGLFADFQAAWKPHALGLMAIAAVGVIIIYSIRMPSNRFMLQIALALTLGGILGNFIDRIVNGFVVDFIEFHIKDAFHWPTFNVADSAISVGIALLLLDTIKNPDSEQDPAPPVHPAPTE